MREYISGDKTKQELTYMLSEFHNWTEKWHKVFDICKYLVRCS